VSAVLVTGASGFVGSALATRLASDGCDLRLALRSPPASLPEGAEAFVHGDLAEAVDWGPALAGVDVVVHCAARVHVMSETVSDPLAEFRRCNVAATLQLARAATEAGVKRLVFVSSVKVNGEATTNGRAFAADDVPAPSDPYGISKLEAERGLFALAGETGIEVVIVRPVLVYGPGVKANFLNMMRWLSKGVPLPLGAIRNKRSLVALDNVVDLIVTCIDHPAAANQVFLVSDGEDLSTSELLQRMGRALGKPARLIPIPARVLATSARLLGKEALAQRLCGSLQVDIEKTRCLLNWLPPVSVENALSRTARYFLRQQ